MFFFQHGIYKIEGILALSRCCMGNAVAVQVGIATDKKFKADQIFFNFNTEVKRATVCVLFLGISEDILREKKPIEANHRPGFEVSLEVRVYVVPLHGREIINNKLAHGFTVVLWDAWKIAFWSRSLPGWNAEHIQIWYENAVSQAPDVYNKSAAMADKGLRSLLFNVICPYIPCPFNLSTA